MFANTVVLPASDTGYTVRELLATAGADLPTSGIRRVACLKIGYFGSNDAYLVPVTGAYTTTVGNIPDQYGYSFAEQGTWFEMAYPQNWISLEDIIIGGHMNDELHVFGYTI